MGNVDAAGQFTGDNNAYVYPDMRAAIVGRFVDGVLVLGRSRLVVGVVDSDPLVKIPTFGPPTGGEVTYSKSTRTDVGQGRTVPDPYECSTVTCGQSEIPGAGEGLFAARDHPPGTVVAFYNGVRIPYELGGPAETWDTSGYKIFVNADYTSGERMDVPEELVDTSVYSASLGHKINHSFDPNCAEWFFDHPRFGVVPCERTVRHVATGEELTLDYEYDPYNCPAWFRNALFSFVTAATEEQLDRLSQRYVRFVRSECKGMADFRKYSFGALGDE